MLTQEKDLYTLLLGLAALAGYLPDQETDTEYHPVALQPIPRHEASVAEIRNLIINPTLCEKPGYEWRNFWERVSNAWRAWQLAQHVIHGVPKDRDAALLAFGRAVAAEKLPQELRMWAAGHYAELRCHGMLQVAMVWRPAVENLLKLIRRLELESIRVEVQTTPAVAIRHYQHGHILGFDEFERHHWELLTWRAGYTTLLNVLYRVAALEYQLFHRKTDLIETWETSPLLSRDLKDQAEQGCQLLCERLMRFFYKSLILYLNDEPS